MISRVAFTWCVRSKFLRVRRRSSSDQDGPAHGETRDWSSRDVCAARREIKLSAHSLARFLSHRFASTTAPRPFAREIGQIFSIFLVSPVVYIYIAVRTLECRFVWRNQRCDNALSHRKSALCSPGAGLFFFFFSSLLSVTSDDRERQLTKVFVLPG